MGVVGGGCWRYWLKPYLHSLSRRISRSSLLPDPHDVKEVRGERGSGERWLRHGATVLVGGVGDMVVGYRLPHQLLPDWKCSSAGLKLKKKLKKKTVDLLSLVAGRS